MAKKQTPVQEPKTIKVSTLIIAVAVLIGMVASFIGGIYTANNYNSTVQAKAVELSKELKSQEQ